MPEPSPAFIHIISQTRQNIELLIAHDQIPEDDGRDILAILARAGSSSGVSVTDLTRKASHLSVSSSKPGVTKVEARALWDWSSEDPSDLNFHAGEIIEIISETNEDWWTGRNRAGKQGLFPSAYVEKLRSSSEKLSPDPFPDTPKSDASSMKTGPVQRYTSSSPAPPYPSPQGPPPPQSYVPPPGPSQQYGPPVPPQQYGAPPGPPIQYGTPYYPSATSPQPAPQQPPKRGKFGNLGATVSIGTDVRAVIIHVQFRWHNPLRVGLVLVLVQRLEATSSILYFDIFHGDRMEWSGVRIR
ncbi:SH3 domain-containing protein [Pisolithus albus]|nr:SH3 domain-containing protein [Pisolithus albus]